MTLSEIENEHADAQSVRSVSVRSLRSVGKKDDDDDDIDDVLSMLDRKNTAKKKSPVSVEVHKPKEVCK